MTDVSVWILVLNMFTPNGLSVAQSPPYDTMGECFYERELIVREMGKPIENDYQAVCIRTDLYFEEAEDGSTD